MKHPNEKGATADKSRLNIPPKDATLPGTNVNHLNHKEEDQEDLDYEDVYEDNDGVDRPR